jgi:beta-lactamase class A
MDPDRVIGRRVLPVAAALVAAALLGPLAGFAQDPGRAATAPNPAAEALKKKFAAHLAEIAGRVDGVMAYTIVDLTSGDRFSQLEQLVAPTASTIKLTVLYELVKQAEEGRLKLDDSKPLDRSKAVEGSGVLYNLGTPALSLRDHATLMVVLSDNTATNVLVDVVGMDAVNARMRGLGLAATRLRRHMMDGAAARRGDENVSSSSDIARLLEALYRGQGLAPASRDEALRILKIRNESKTTPLLRGVPGTVDVASKPGELEGVRVDAGIVWAAKRPYIFSAMTTYLQDDEAGAKAIEELARTAYEYFSRLGAGTEYGRQIGRQ